MSEIATYRCTDDKCRLTVHLSRQMPVWHPETPTALRSLDIKPEAQQYVIGYRTEAYCHGCRKVQESNTENRCARCGESSAPIEQAGLPCPQCKRGEFFMQHLIVR